MAQDISPAAKIVASEVKAAVVQTINDPGVSLASNEPHLAASDVAQKVAVAVDQIVAHLTDNEPWYQSRVVWGSIIGVVGTFAALFGINVTEAQQASYINLAVTLAPVLVGAGLALYGRYFAKKPLGT